VTQGGPVFIIWSHIPG